MNTLDMLWASGKIGSSLVPQRRTESYLPVLNIEVLKVIGTL
ncbi:hypothetical protein [Vibrio gallaecicus]|nr:hypothetical protein [Vibrio gallaecicus]MDN3615085.1 hypothetical protein [Vibrio gallaecicus]